MYPHEVIDNTIKDRDLSNEKVAVAAGLAARTVSKIRNGDPDVRLPSLQMVADALDLELQINFIPKVSPKVAQV